MMKVPDNVVPFSQPSAAPQVDPKYLAMAAGLMHQEGRLFAQNEENPLKQVPTVPMTKDFWDDYNKESARGFGGGGILQRYETTVDQFIKQQGLKPNDQFKVEHPDGPRFYKYLGPDSGTRKDWMQIKQSNSNLVS